MVKSATGVAASASMRTIASIGPTGFRPVAELAAPSAMAQGNGLNAAPRNAVTIAARCPCLDASCHCASAMHTELVRTMSTTMVEIIVPAAAGPTSVTTSRMNPVLGKAATCAPNAASFRLTEPRHVSAMVRPIIRSAHTDSRCSKIGLLFDHLVGLSKKRRRNRYAEGFQRLQIDHELELGGLNDRQICRLGAFENPAGVDADLMIRIRNARSVAHQATNGGAVAKLINRRHRVTGCQRDDLTASAEQERIGGD